ncbi:MAG: methionine gamma-lyase [Rhodospirillaceae bacterium]|nr:methionine gamma-lyase [Rhodospirillaceae bacterium]|tara:strand:- start:8027 stop:9247 length:1221 start_codon:yes stop_codon:yes gene_type:complete
MTDGNNRPQGFATRAIHLGYDPMDENGALTQPIYLTSTYAFESAEAGGELFRGERKGYIYGRNRNPTQALLEERMASLEGAEAGLALASGMGAISALCWTLLEAGDEVVIDHTLYGNTFALFTKGLPKFGVTVTPVDLTNLETLDSALSSATKLVFFETPANPNLRVIDIAAVAARAQAKGALTVVDNTFCTPALQRPIEQDADLVIHSATKYLGGHGDLLAGVICGEHDTVHQIRQHGLRYLTGATISPLTAFLVMRGLKTLELRMERHSDSALAVAKMLQDHPAVASVEHPWLDDFAQADAARRQMSRGGGLVSFELHGGYDAGMAFMNGVDLITRAVSLGDAETLVQHPASMTHATYTPEERAAHGISEGLIRMSVGLENIADILQDIDAALDAAMASRAAAE